MSLELEHKKACEDSSYLQSKLEAMISKVECDTSGACWDTQSVKQFSYREYDRLTKLSSEDKNNLPFFGLTVGIKDLFCVSGLRTTAGSKILENFVSPYDSTVWSTVKNKGVLLGGKLAMDEFAMGSFTNTSPFGKVTIDEEHTAGGSSGGSGAAMMNNLFDFTIGSDTGGSVRLPAAFCSVVGYKPSYGAFSRYGMISYASSLDQAGFFTKDLSDLEYILKAEIADKDNNDATQLGLGKYESENKQSLTVGVFPKLFGNPAINPEIKVEYAKTITELQKTHTVVEVDIPIMDVAAQLYYIIACAEASSNLARYQGIYYGKQLIEERFSGTFWEQTAQLRSKYLGVEVQKRIMLGSYLLSSENFDILYNKSRNLRKALTHELTQVLQRCDCIVLPSAPYKSPKWSEIDNMTTAEIYMADFLTVPFSLAGLPAVSVPVKTGVGMQWVGSKFKDYQLIRDVKGVYETL